ncbi:response regulator transcription factor [Paenibacillus sp. Soil522]|uniref:response regulator transcription factor n=1 Tax=Paenibacillus sp. Soil522 TaxID=1736388 RepID=UPI0006F58927|nr:response regulator [Paenibacillus sp. Soil522]KRE36795.1 AraC family transcriptional regulator [Paenibacillus sp. Soil522]
MSSILLVDDERWVRTALRKVIERSGHPFQVVKECSNGLEALEWLENNTAHVIMTDVKMPVMDGITLVKQLQERKQQTEVVMISGYDDFPYLQFALRAQVVDYLLKPVEVDDMSSCLETIQGRLAKVDAAKPLAAAADEDEQESPIQQAVRYIHSVLPGDITLQEVAAKVHLNPSYLSQLFKQQMKINFIDYVLEHRMEKAKQFLSQTTLRVSEIAERVGYSDLAYFSNAYKRITGMTPSEYRKSRT